MLKTALKACDEMLDPPALPTALLNDEFIVKVCSLGDFKASVCCFVYDCLALPQVERKARVRQQCTASVCKKNIGVCQ